MRVRRFEREQKFFDRTVVNEKKKELPILTIRNMFNRGFSITQISEELNLPEYDIMPYEPIN